MDFRNWKALTLAMPIVGVAGELSQGWRLRSLARVVGRQEGLGSHFLPVFLASTGDCRLWEFSTKFCPTDRHSRCWRTLKQSLRGKVAELIRIIDDVDGFDTGFGN